MVMNSLKNRCSDEFAKECIGGKISFVSCPRSQRLPFFIFFSPGYHNAASRVFQRFYAHIFTAEVTVKLIVNKNIILFYEVENK
jgi:hypothetical protein